jgi:hypothetical protein
MAQPIVKTGCAKNLFVRQLHFKNAGDQEQGPSHKFEYLSLLAKGRLAVQMGDAVTEFTAPQLILTKANARHQLEALTDGVVVYSIYVLRDASGDIVSQDAVLKSHEMYELIGELVDKS